MRSGNIFERLIEDTRSASVDTSGDELASRLSELGLEQLAAMWGKDGPSARDAKLKNALHLLLDVPAEILGDDRDAILEELTEKMLKAGVDPLARRAELYQETPLTLALRKSREPVSLKVIELLADAQTDWTVPYRYGTPLAIALDKPLSKIRKDQRERAAAIIDLLRGYKEAALNGTAFTKMCENGEIEWIEQAISDGA